MKITETDLNNFKILYKKHFWIDLEDKQALEYANSLLSLTKTLLLNNNNYGN